MASICVLVSLKLEVDCLLDRLRAIGKRCAGRFVLYEGKLGETPVRVIRTGTGEHRIDPSLLGDCSIVVSTGVCGALTEALHTGDVVIADEVATALGKQLDIVLEGSRDGYPLSRSAVLSMKPHGLDLEKIIGTLESLEIRVYRGRALTVSRIIRTPEEKRRLRVHFQALACNMEDFFRAARLKKIGVPVVCARVVLDELLDDVPGVNGAFAQKQFKTPPLFKKLPLAQRSITSLVETIASFTPLFIS